VNTAVTHGTTKASSNEPRAPTVETKHEHPTPKRPLLTLQHLDLKKTPLSKCSRNTWKVKETFLFSIDRINQHIVSYIRL
jgi:hypothetical protein